MDSPRYTVHTYRGHAWILDTHATLEAYGTLSGPPIAIKDRSGRIHRYKSLTNARRRARRLNGGSL
jgi:hypothetical protein